MSIGVLDRLEDVEDVRKRVADGLTGVSRVVVVMSGKGGVGKSAVSVNLAEAMAMQGLSVGILDAELQGPTGAKMLGLRGRPGRGAGDLGLEPAACPSGVVVQSMDFFLQGAQALDWDGRDGAGATLRSAFEHAALADLLGQTHWGELDLLVVDLPPGADRLPALAQWLPGHLGEGLAVTIPTEVALLAVERSLRRALDLRFPMIDLVENLGTSVCRECGVEGPLFHEASSEPLAHRTGREVIARIPFDPALSAAADAGESFLQTAQGAASGATGRAFFELAGKVAAYDRPGPEGESW